MPQQSLLHPASPVAGIGRDVRAHRPAQEMVVRLTGQEGQPRDHRVADVAVDIHQAKPDHLARKALRRGAKATRDPPQPAGKKLVRFAFGPIRPQCRPGLIHKRLDLQVGTAPSLAGSVPSLACSLVHLLSGRCETV
jgi:hypothetical protein